MVNNFEDCLVFIGQWFDKLASIERPFKIFHYLFDGSTEIIDAKSGKVHLRRIKTEQVTQDKLQIGNSITIFGRTYRLTEFGDNVTKQSFS